MASSFDPSVIGSISSRAGDPAGSIAKGLTLKSMIEEGQLNALRLKGAQSEMDEAAKTKSIMSGQDVTTSEGRMKAAEALSKAGLSNRAIELMKLNTEQEGAEQNRQLIALKLADAKMDAMAGGFDSVLAKLDQMAKSGAKPQQLDAAAGALAKEESGRILQAHPDLAKSVQGFLSDPANLTYAGIKSFEARSNEGQKLIKARLDAANITSEIEERGARTKALKEGRLVPVQNTDGTITYVPSSEAKGRQVGSPSSGGFTPEMSDLQAALTEQGVVIPSGFRSRAQQVSLFSGLLARNKGKSADEIATGIKNGQISFTAEKGSVAQLTKMEGATRQAVKQLDFNVGKASEFMNKVPAQTDLSPIVNAIVNKEETWTGNPNMAPLFFYMNGVAQEAARLQSGGQASAAQLHQGAADEARKWLDAGAITPASWKKLAPEIQAEGRNRLQTFIESESEMRTKDKNPTTVTDWSSLK